MYDQAGRETERKIWYNIYLDWNVHKLSLSASNLESHLKLLNIIKLQRHLTQKKHDTWQTIFPYPCQ
jgi:hypothetical protein